MGRMAYMSCLIFCLSKLASQPPPCPSFHQVKFEPSENTMERSDDLLFPVVVHVIETSNSPLVSDREITGLLDILNNDFDTNIDLSRPELEVVGSRLGKVGFRFKLAEIGPNGIPANGIIRKATVIDNIGDFLSQDEPSMVKTSVGGGSDPWDVDNYINIWISERNISLGATVAENSVSQDIEGLVLSFEAVKSFPKTIAHEMGHYFGLLHPWGNTTGCDNEDDGIADTPFQESPNFNCRSGTNCGVKFTPGNIMDFGSDDCLLYFTKLQASSMQHFASQFKKNLIESDNCFFNNFPRQTNNVFINNTSANIEVYIENPASLEKAILYDFSGKVFKSRTVGGQDFLNIPTDGIPPGVYVLRLTGNNSEFAQKIIVSQ